MTTLSTKLTLPLIIVTALSLLLMLSPPKASAGAFGFFDFFKKDECPCNYAAGIAKTTKRGNKIGANVSFFFCSDDEPEATALIGETNDCVTLSVAATDDDFEPCADGSEFCCQTGGVCGHVGEQFDGVGVNFGFLGGFADLTQKPITEAEYEACRSKINSMAGALGAGTCNP